MKSQLKNMRAVVLTGHGRLDKLEYREDVTRPSAGSGEVLIRVSTSSINNTDLNTRTGWYSPEVTSGLTPELGSHGLSGSDTEPNSWDRSTMDFPRIQGAAIVGVIVAVGSGVEQSRVGERVIVDPVIRDNKLPRWGRGVKFIGSECDGGYADYAAVPAVNAAAVQTTLSNEQLACVPCAYSTAEEMLVRGAVRTGDIVLVTGASGGVGSAAVELSKIRGARVLAVAGTSKEDAVRRRGADLFIPRGVSDLAEAVHSLIGERQVDVVIDVTGGDSVLGMLRVLKRAGRYVTAGAIAGPMSTIDLRDLIYKDLQMIGVANPEAESFENLVRYVNAGQLNPVVDRVYSLPKVSEAQEYFMSKQHVGKVVISIEDGAPVPAE